MGLDSRRTSKTGLWVFPRASGTGTTTADLEIYKYSLHVLSTLSVGSAFSPDTTTVLMRMPTNGVPNR